MTESEYRLGFVLASKYRKNVVKTLQEKSMTPGEIAKETEIYPSHISTALKELTDKKIVVCVTPKLKKGRLYNLTKEGKKILEEIM